MTIYLPRTILFLQSQPKTKMTTITLENNNHFLLSKQLTFAELIFIFLSFYFIFYMKCEISINISKQMAKKFATLVGKDTHRTSARSCELNAPTPLAAAPEGAVPAPDTASPEAEAEAGSSRKVKIAHGSVGSPVAKAYNFTLSPSLSCLLH